MCLGYDFKASPVGELIPVWLTKGESLSFYKAYGEGHCKGCTPWCVKHCYMNIREFLNDRRGDILCLKNLKDGFENIRYRNSFLDDMKKVMYITFFGSGTVNTEGDIKFIKDITNGFPGKKYRVFIRSLENIELLYGNNIILSVDCDTPQAILEKALKDKNINIAVLDHPDNHKTINKLKPAFKNIIKCEDCLKQTCNLLKDCDHLCFKAENRYLLIQNYEEVKNYV